MFNDRIGEHHRRRAGEYLRDFRCKSISSKSLRQHWGMGNSVTAARVTLDHLVKVQILVPQLRKALCGKELRKVFRKASSNPSVGVNWQEN